MLASELITLLHQQVDDRQKQLINLCQNNGQIEAINDLYLQISLRQSRSRAVLTSIVAKGDWQLSDEEEFNYFISLA